MEKLWLLSGEWLDSSDFGGSEVSILRSSFSIFSEEGVAADVIVADGAAADGVAADRVAAGAAEAVTEAAAGIPGLEDTAALKEWKRE